MGVCAAVVRTDTDEEGQGPGKAGLKILVDPTREEGTGTGAGTTIAAQPSIVSLCTLPALGSVSALDHSGGANLTLDEVDSVVQVLTTTSAQVHMAAAEALQEAAAAATLSSAS